MIGCVLLCSGFGARFGGNKLLEKIEGKPLYRHTFDLLSALKSEEITVAVVSRYGEITAAAAEAGLLAVYNDHAEEGISSSLLLGVEALPDVDWYAFFVADQPWLRVETVRGFFEETLRSGKSLGSVHSGGVPGNPTLFHRRWRQALLSLNGDKGGRVVLRAHPEDVFWYEVAQRERIDIDRREQLCEKVGE